MGRHTRRTGSNYYEHVSHRRTRPQRYRAHGDIRTHLAFLRSRLVLRHWTTNWGHVPSMRHCTVPEPTQSYESIHFHQNEGKGEITNRLTLDTDLNSHQKTPCNLIRKD